MDKRLSSAYNDFEERLGVLRQFRIHSFLVLLVVGIGIIFYLNTYIRSDVLERIGESAAFVSDTTISPLLNKNDLKWPPSKESSQKYNDIIKNSLLEKSRKDQAVADTDNIVAAKIWNKDGRVIYDSTGKTDGEVHKNNNELEDSLENRVHSSFTQNDSEDRFIQDGSKDLIELYVPIHLKGIKEPVGAYEMYLATNTINEFTRNTLGIIIAIVLLGLLFLYVSLSWFFARAHNRIAQKNNELKKITDKLIHSLKELEENYLGTIQALAMAVDAKDHYTAGHSFRVASFSKEIGKLMGLSDDSLRDLERGARFHDIGKIGIAEHILNKKGSLTEVEYDEMKRHTILGGKILGQVKFLKDIGPIVRWHHERLDGSGYPDGLRKENIPLAARIVAVADVFDSMTSDRPYRAAFETEVAFEELKGGCGVKYDEEAVQALIEAYSGASCVFCEEGDTSCLITGPEDKDKSVSDAFTKEDIEKIWADSNSESGHKSNKKKAG